MAFNAYDELVTDGGTTNTYDALNRLVGTGSRTLSYEGLTRTISAAGTDTYSNLPDGTPLGVRQGTTRSLSVTDLHTDVVATVDPTTGMLVSSRAYGPFGDVQSTTGTPPALGYQHQWTDPTTGDVNMGARWYQSGTGAFSSRDTAALDPRDLLNANRHAYAASNPLTSIDPSGNWWTPVPTPVLPIGVAIPVLAAGGAAVGVGAMGTVAAIGAAAVVGGFIGYALYEASVTRSVKNKFKISINRGGRGGIRYPDGQKPVTGNIGTVVTPDIVSFPSDWGSSWGDEVSAWVGGWATQSAPAVSQAVLEELARAARVRDNALTEAARPELSQTISGSVQALIDAAASAPAIALGNLVSGGKEQAFAPTDTQQATPFLPAQEYLDDSCHTGGRLGTDPFGQVTRGASIWTCGDAPGAGSSGDCVSNSFTPETPVLMADGTTKPIEDVNVGDEVMASDPVDGRTESRPVTATIVGAGEKTLVDVTVDADGDGDSDGVITATDGHPFWVDSAAEWREASELHAGDLLRTPAGSTVWILAVATHTLLKRVHNLTVNGLHTYYVLAGLIAVLVHNSSGCGPVAYGSTELSRIAVKHRIQAGIEAGQNVAIYSIELPNGRIANLAFVNTVRRTHSEGHADEFFAGIGLDPRSVRDIYSERNFCLTEGHECAGRMSKFVNARLSWSFEHGENAAAAIRRYIFG
ncbi:polymorphic toxin-type HINT domain-containing protein [Saccharothrix violaceirubra]|uniref:RHS repeat-associated protein n=1 Tax=Saccharothrix violaceirubra TaxID=413306 RepID=A0A7W7T3R9_9PSEU|nr:polymorphic toxin-type HINT domain-containing protein [Saccharothrix violaceirubra]MBB4966029.1 RHS repeat-associated protein [Saccharothrix violaceirubra]